eukprot:jgi/Mesvir1/9695/Mv12173-RA.1
MAAIRFMRRLARLADNSVFQAGLARSVARALSSQPSTGAGQVESVSQDSLHDAARRTLTPPVQLPDKLKAAIHEIITEGDDFSSRRLRIDAQRLSVYLRAMSNSNPLHYLQESEVSDHARAALQQAMMHKKRMRDAAEEAAAATMTPLDPDWSGKGWEEAGKGGAVPPWEQWSGSAFVPGSSKTRTRDAPEGRHARVRDSDWEDDVAPDMRYSQSITRAYVAARLPAIFAVMQRIFKEVATLLPDFRPSTMLDFGSGPGTAIWCAGDVWAQHMHSAVAVEPAPEMAHVASHLRKGFPHLAHIGVQRVQFLSRLRGAAQHGKYPLVVAAYSLGEIEDERVRSAIVRSLWSRSSDLLVLIEPGTPRGYDVIRAARAQILKEHWKLKRSKASGGGAAREDASEGADASDIMERPQPCYVVAPCPHDGGCPMAGTKGWCHFPQRLDRPHWQRVIKHFGKVPLPYEDEKFSYVVLRKSERPSPVKVNVYKVEEPLDEDENYIRDQIAITPPAWGARANRLVPMKTGVGAEHVSAVEDEEEGEEEEETPEEKEERAVAGTGPVGAVRTTTASQSSEVAFEAEHWPHFKGRNERGPAGEEAVQGSNGTPAAGGPRDVPSLQQGADSMAGSPFPSASPAKDSSREPSAGVREPGVVTTTGASTSLVVKGRKAMHSASGGGKLQRFVVARSQKKRHVLGRGKYSFAKKCLWGDLWPYSTEKHRL